MSSPSTSAPAVKKRTNILNARPTIPPITTLDNNTARLMTHLHPVLVLSVFASRFGALVADPVSSLLTTLFAICGLQAVYAVTCLPAVGSLDTATVSSSKSTSGAASRRKGSSSITTAIFSTLLTLLLGTPVITIVLVLFGAPATTHIPHTLSCAAHLAALAALPLFYVHGVDKERWRRVGSLLMPIDEVYGAAVGSFLGAWIGAVPIPLDWDRDWQKWPITIVTGAYIGWAVGKLAGKYVFYGKTIDLSA